MLQVLVIDDKVYTDLWRYIGQVLASPPSMIACVCLFSLSAFLVQCPVTASLVPQRNAFLQCTYYCRYHTVILDMSYIRVML
jgi:hypothetical protein